MKLLSPLIFYIGLFFLLLVWSCSPKNNAVLNVHWHNLTAHYNAYFIAKEHMKAMEQEIIKSQQHNYDKVLKIFPPLDSSIINSHKKGMEDCIEKAAMVIQRHENSAWVDDAYLLVGKARYYRKEFEHAIETFKYLNINSKDKNVRHHALILLMRVFIDHNEINNAIAVTDFLKKEKNISDQNLQRLYLTIAYFYERNNDFNNVAKYVERAIPYLSNKEEKAKYHFILGQIYQNKNNETKSFKNYRIVLKSSPSYEIFFYTKLNMAQVWKLANTKDLQKVRKYFHKLLKDKKHKDFKDKIYYEIANFEYKNEHIKEALENYALSVQNSTSNQRQKGLSYLSMGRIYYEDIKEFELSQAYYDSTIQVLPKDHEGYESIRKRKEALDRFVENLNTLHLQDSLITLAKMDSSSLSQFLDRVLAAKREEKEKEAKEIKRKSRFTRFENEGNLFGPSDNTNSTWYFYSPIAISQGTNEFIKKWGDRKLEDNWRRALKEAPIEIAETKTNEIEESTVLPAKGKDTGADSEKEALYKTIPFSEEDMSKALKMIEQSLYNLGEIYTFGLEEKDNGLETFNTLLVRFPETEYRAEVLYRLYILYKEKGDLQNSEIPKQELLDLYPNTTYAKLILNPNYLEEARKALAATKRIYEISYLHFKENKLDSTLDHIRNGLENFAENEYTDNLSLLRAMVFGKWGILPLYKESLKEFIIKFPESELIEKAEFLLAGAEAFEEKYYYESEATKFAAESSGNQSFVMIFRKSDKITEKLISKISKFNLKEFPDTNLKIKTRPLGKTRLITQILIFKSKTGAMEYHDKLKAENSLWKEFSKCEIHKFVANKPNVEILIKSKDINAYKAYFERNYFNVP